MGLPADALHRRMGQGRTAAGPSGCAWQTISLNPAYTSNKQVTPVDEEIQRIYDQTGDASVVPQRPERYITVDRGTD